MILKNPDGSLTTVNSDVPFSGIVLFGGFVGFAGVTQSVSPTKIVTPIQTVIPTVNTGVALMGLEVPQKLSLSC